MRKFRPTSGYSLMEAILASFLLIGSFLLVGKLFHRGLQYSATVNARVTAVHLAEQHMARVRRAVEEQREWVEPAGNFPEHPEYDVDVKFENVRLFSPCSELERIYPFVNRRSINESTRRAVVTVKWGKGSSKSFTLTSYVNQAPGRWRQNNPIKIRRVEGSNPIGPGERIRYEAVGYDDRNQEIKDLFFNWNVVPIYGDNSAVGRVWQNRNGQFGYLSNRVQTVDGNLLQLKGFCRLTATAMFDGWTLTVAGPEAELTD